MKLTGNKTFIYIVSLFCCAFLLFGLTGCGGGGGGSSIDIGHYFLVQAGFDGTTWKTSDGTRTLSFDGSTWTMIIGGVNYLDSIGASNSTYTKQDNDHYIMKAIISGNSVDLFAIEILSSSKLKITEKYGGSASFVFEKQ